MQSEKQQSTMTTRSRSRTKPKKNILLSDIKFNSTCVSLELPFHLACDICKPKIEAASCLSKKSSKKNGKRFCDMTERKRCRQPWASKHATDSKTIGTITNFTKTREYLKVDANVILDSRKFYSL